jgi:hypothetical protein
MLGPKTPPLQLGLSWLAAAIVSQAKRCSAGAEPVPIASMHSSSPGSTGWLVARVHRRAGWHHQVLPETPV